MKKLITIITILIITTTSSFSQSPEKMSYQAVVRDANNSLLISQGIGMKISILQGGVSGTIVFSETHSPSTNSNGLVTIEIGIGLVINGNFSTIDWANGPYFIKTETDPTGGSNYTITSTSQLMSVPYAFYTSNAEYVINDNDSQQLSITGSSLSISNGNSVTLPAGNTGDITSVTAGTGIIGCGTSGQ